MGELIGQLASAVAANAWFTVVCGLASVASLIISVIIERRTSAFSQWLFRRERLPDLRRDLDNQGRQLTSLLVDLANNRQDILDVLARVRAIAGSLASKLGRADRVGPSNLAADIDRLLRTVDVRGPSEQDCRRLSTRISELRENLKQLVKDERRRTSP